MRHAAIIAAAAVLTALCGPASAWEQQGGAAAPEGGLRALPGGGLMLKDVPAMGGNLQNLPGVRLNQRAQDKADGGNCSNSEVSYYEGNQFRSGTVNECKFGNFSISTMRPSGPSPYEPQPLPGSGLSRY